MKRSIFLSVMLAFTIAGLAQQKAKSPYEGAWKLVGVTSVSGNTVTNWKSAEFGNQVKMWTGNHFSFTGMAKDGNSQVDLFGYGTYTLNGNDYEESIVFHNDKSMINTKFRCTLEFRSDTLYQKGYYIDASGKKVAAIEKYVKLE